VTLRDNFSQESPVVQLYRVEQNEREVATAELSPYIWARDPQGRVSMRNDIWWQIAPVSLLIGIKNAFKIKKNS